MATQAVSATPTKAPSSTLMDDEIAQLWAQVEERVLQMAKGDQSKIKGNLKIEDVLNYLDQVQDAERNTAEKYSTARHIFNRTLQAISTIGGIVADGASNVFAPASMCYNALTFVIEAWRGYEGIFDSLATLLEKLGEFFERLVEYSRIGMNKSLSRVACQFLELFVLICDRALELKRKRGKVAAFMKQLFLNDDGMKEFLTRMKSLADKEHGLVSAQTWSKTHEAVSYSRDILGVMNDTGHQVGSLVEGQNQQRKDTETVKRRRVVAKALEIDISISSTDKSPWDEAFQRHKKTILEGTGEWLAEDSRFVSWLKNPDNDKPILGIEGGGGSGKTTLTASIIARLKRVKTSEGLAPSSCTAYWFIEKDSKSAANSQQVAFTATKSLLWQLAELNEPYMKSLAAICEKTGAFTKSQEMWTQLLLDNDDRMELNSAFFLVVDGLDENVSEFLPLLRRLSDRRIASRTRVLLTGSKTVFSTLESNNIDFNKITLGEPNKPDIRIFVTVRMNSIDVLKDTERPDVTAMREKILDSLTAMTDGDYYKKGRVLDDIEKTDFVEDIEELLKTAGLARLDKIEADIDKLNETRTAKEISEINEIILWINDAREWLKPNEMEAALALKGLRESTGTQTSLMSLEAKIRTKYSIFNVDAYNDVDYKVEGIRDKIPLKKRHIADQESPSGYKDILPAEINIVKHYLSSLCPPDVYRKFGFDEFFDQKMIRKMNYICQDPDNSHITLALRCMGCLIEDRTEKMKPLHEYAIRNVLYHLNDIDLALSDREFKSEIGILLHRLFTENQAVSSLFWGHSRQSEDGWTPLSVDALVGYSQTDTYGWCDWLFSGKGIAVVAKMFDDSAVLEKVKNKQLVTDFKNKESERHLILLEHVAKKAARHLFREEQLQLGIVYNFMLLHGILTKANKHTTEIQDMSETLQKLFDPTLQEIDLVEDWSQKALEISTKDSLWEACKAALLLHAHKGNPGKITRENVDLQARKALELDSTSYSARYTLAKVAESDEEARSLLATLVEDMHTDSEWRAKDDHKTILADVMVTLGDKYWAAETQTERAITTYSQALDVSCSRMILRRYSEILRQYGDREQWKAVIDCVEKLTTDLSRDEEERGTFIMRCASGASGPGFPSLLERAVKAEDRWDLVETVFQKAVSATKDEYWTLYYVRRNWGEVLARREGYENAAIETWEVALKHPAKPDSEHLRPWFVDELTRLLVTIHLQLVRVKSKNKQLDLVEYHDTKVESLYKEFEANGRGGDDSRLAFARYFHLRGNDQEAKRVIKKSTLESLDMLSDDDIENDYISLWVLGKLLFVLEDIPNAKVAWDMMAQSRQEMHNVYLAKQKAWEEKNTLRNETASKAKAEASPIADSIDNGADGTGEMTQVLAEEDGEPADEKTQTGEEEEVEPAPEEPQRWIAYCDGGCGHKWDFPSEIWVCTNCGSIQFNEECYQKLQAGTLEVDGCGKDHRFYFIGKRDEKKYSELRNGYVFYGDKMIKFEDWKTEIKAKYVSFE